MPSNHRIVLPGAAHHVVQRGNRRQNVFFNDVDKRFYLKLLREQSDKFGLKILSYCLMDNHVHLVIVPSTVEGMSRAMAELHRGYTRVINQIHEWRGFLWQGRFGSSVMEGTYLLRGMRYVEQNPVSAGMVKRAEDYPWSSAPAHVLGMADPLLSFCPELSAISDWRGFLRAREPQEFLDKIRRVAAKGLPLGDDAFIKEISQQTGVDERRLKLAPIGRPKNNSTTLVVV